MSREKKECFCLQSRFEILLLSLIFRPLNFVQKLLGHTLNKVIIMVRHVLLKSEKV